MTTRNKPDFQPSAAMLEKYAQVLVNFALNSGEGVNAGEVVICRVPDVAKPLALALQNTLLKAGAYPMMRLSPTGFAKDFFDLASQEQLEFFPRKFLHERAELADHHIGIIADPDPYELSEVNPKKIMQARNSKKPYRDWLITKENKGKFTWTAALWGTEAKAKEVGLTLEEYWQQIYQACLLNEVDPVAKWRELQAMKEEIKQKLNDLKINFVTMKGADVDLKVAIGEDRIWQGGGGRNIPSFEIFTSPDWRGVDGWIHFNQPLYRYGNIIKDIELKIEHGLVVEAKAKTGNKLLQAILETKNANKIGEFSLTDSRMSHITHVMAETLFDENIGGPFGNTHLAVGMAYQDCYRGDASSLKKEDWEAKGFNDSSEHTDIISTTDRTVTAYLADGSSLVIYKDGKFVV